MNFLKKTAILLFALALSACGGGGSGESPNSMGALQVSPDTVIATSGQTINFTITGGQGPYRIQSSNATAVSVPDTVNNLNAGNFVATVGRIDETEIVTLTVIDSKGARVTAEVTVKYRDMSLSPNVLTLTAGQSQVFNIYGGQSPFQVSVSNTTYLSTSVTDIGKGEFTLTAAAGSADKTGLVVTVTDAAGKTAVANISVTSSFIFGSMTALPISTDTTATMIHSGEPGFIRVQTSATYVGVRSLKFHVTSGPMTLTGADANGDLTLNTSATGLVEAGFTTQSVTGPATVRVRITDVATGQTADLVVQLVGRDLRGAPETIGLGGDCKQSGLAVVIGGIPPYSVTTSNAAVAKLSAVAATTYASMMSVSDEGGAFQVTGQSCGEAVITIRDSANATAAIAVTAVNTTPVLGALSVSPDTVTQAYPLPATACTGNTHYVVIAGGVAPYGVLSSDPSIVQINASSVAASGGYVALTGVSCGSATVVITDAHGDVVRVAFSSSNP